MTEIEFARQIIFRRYPGRITILVLSELIGAFLVIIGIGAVVPLLDALLDAKNKLPGIIGEFFEAIGLSEADGATIMAFLLALLLVRFMLDGLRSYLAGSIGIHLNRQIREQMNFNLLNIDWSKFTTINKGKYLQCMTVESSLARGAVNDLGSVLAYGIISIFLLGSMALLSSETFLISLVMGGFFMITAGAIMKKSRREAQIRIEAMNEMNNLFTDNTNLFKLLKAEGLAPERRRKTDALIERVAHTELRQLLYVLFIENYTKLMGVIMMAVVSFAFLVLGRGEGATLVFDLLLLQRVVSYFGNFQSKRRNMIQKIPSYQSCVEMMATVVPIVRAHRPDPARPSLEDGITFEDVTYTYPDETVALRGLTLSLPAKGLALLLGRSGSGKTTIGDMLLRIITPQSGRVAVDGHALCELAETEWSKMVAYVPQDAYLFEGTLRENLIFGSNGATDDMIIGALERADSEAFIRALPKGLDTEVKPGGANFSGGERHRLSIARALLRGARLLVMDEPSASLDKDSEMEIFRSLQKLSRDVLIVIITHSQNLIEGSDNLYLIASGRCIWTGNYTELRQRTDLFDLSTELAKTPSPVARYNSIHLEDNSR